MTKNVDKGRLKLLAEYFPCSEVLSNFQFPVCSLKPEWSVMNFLNALYLDHNSCTCCLEYCQYRDSNNMYNAGKRLCVCACVHVILFMELFVQTFCIFYRFSRHGAQKDSILRLNAFHSWNGTERLVQK
jgi:hypothetical protein